MIYSIYFPATDILDYLCETFTLLETEELFYFNEEEPDFIPHQSFVNVANEMLR